MCFQIMGLPAWIFAYLASKRFLTSVGKHVIFQSAWPPAREAALIAGKGILSRMLQHVFLDIISLDAWIVALVTTEMPLPWMCWHVLFEVAPLCEGRGTMGAFKGLLPWISEGWVWFNPCSTVDHWYTCTLKVVPSYRVYLCQKIKKAPGKKVAPWRLLGACAPFLKWNNGLKENQGEERPKGHVLKLGRKVKHYWSCKHLKLFCSTFYSWGFLHGAKLVTETTPIWTKLSTRLNILSPTIKPKNEKI